MMPLIPIAMALAQFAPMIAGWLGGSKAEDVATKVVGVAQAVTGQSAPDAALAAIQADPNLALQFQKAVLEQQGQLAQIAAEVAKAELVADTANTLAVNQTMQIEAKADHWPTYSWRPFVGFCFGFAWVGAYFIIPILRGWWPQIAQPSIPPEAWVAIGGVLGVASFFRGKMQADPRVTTDNRG
ncbi:MULTISPECIES: 3TM-type holin [unclassified Burkholderia]|uniref:3TM-type holin n=1 Tax=unclassified Burkholderia TaxID=2613784 RepID=UPI001E5AECFA|nr:MULTISPECIES: 3TM-type holin [unclassified Burkholderia]UEP31623.1 3TM-type holin [Burkholderia sp. B21-007]UEP43131.1 3TM-type holin [Burkholderia sp. B21-005]